MRTEQLKIYKFEELPDDAKEAAREWYRQGAFDYDWYDAVYEDFQEILNILGFTVGIRKGANSFPTIYFSGFWSQGDGASFEADYQYKKGALAKIKEYAPQDEELHRIATELQEVQKRNFYGLYTSIRQRGNYYHEMTMYIPYSISRDDGKEPTEDAEEVLLDCARDLARWLYKTLEKEFDYLNADEQVDEMLIDGDYEFTEDGSIY